LDKARRSRHKQGKKGVGKALKSSGDDGIDRASIDATIDYFLSHRVSTIQELLRSHEVPVSGSKTLLRKRLKKAIDDGSIDVNDLSLKLEAIEGWGNQHVVLFQSTGAAADCWKSKTHVRNSLKEGDCFDLLNTHRALYLLDQPTLCQVKWSMNHLQLVWLQKKEWPLRRKDLDPPRKVLQEGEVFYKAFEVKYRRSVCMFDWNLDTCEAALLMHHLPDEGYDTLRQQLLQDMARILDPVVFEVVQLHRVIERLEKSGEVTKRNLQLATVRRTEVTLRSASRHSDIYSDPNAGEIRKAVGQGGVTKRGQFYWVPDGKLIRQHVPLRVYPRNERFSLHAECTEAEVRHVLSRIRHHCR
jgi:hypothetical protein